jgi:hypothetical protein
MACSFLARTSADQQGLGAIFRTSAQRQYLSLPVYDFINKNNASGSEICCQDTVEGLYWDSWMLPYIKL